jgi:nucleotide-binding universal stress UspA family protein
MRNVLLVTSPLTEAKNATAYALERAKAIGGGLVALAVLDPEVSQRVASTLTNVGFVGEKISDSIVDTLAREQRAQAEALLREVGELAAKAGVPYTPLIEQGDPSEVCARAVETHDVLCAVLVAEKRSWLTRLLARGAAVKLPALAGCEVKVMED